MICVRVIFLMMDDQRKDDHRSLRPQLQVRIQSDHTKPVAVHLATPDSLNNTPAQAGADSDEEGTLQQPSAVNGRNKSTKTPFTSSRSFWRSENLPLMLRWIPANWSWSRWKPVLRSALAAWIGLLLFLIPTTLNVMGQVCIFRYCLPFARSDKPPGSFPDHYR